MGGCAPSKHDDAKHAGESSSSIQHPRIAVPATGAASSGWSCNKHKTGDHGVYLTCREVDGRGFLAMLCNALEAAQPGLAVFWDTLCLNDGEDRQVTFRAAMDGADLMLLLVSPGALDGFAKNAATRQDSLLNEWETAVERARSGRGLMMPVFIGDLDFNAAGRSRVFPDAKHFMRANDPDAPTIRATIDAVLNTHGPRVAADLPPADVERIVERILALLGNRDAQLARAQARHAAKQAEFQAGQGLSKGKLATADTNTRLENENDAIWERIRPIVEAKDVIGVGISVTVYKGLLDGTLPVAVKAARSADAMEKFAAEAEVMMGLNHPNLMPCLFSLKRGDGHYIVMPLCDAGTLESPSPAAKAALANGRSRLQVALDAAMGVAYLHSQKIIHQNLKPQVFLLATETTATSLHVYVDDYYPGEDNVTAVMRRGAATMMVGTPGFLAPESVDGLMSPKSDSFAFGVCLLQLMTGMPACRVEGKGNNARIVRLCDEARNDARPAAEQAKAGVIWDPPGSLEGLRRLALDCTEMDPLSRPSMADIVLALTDLLMPYGGPSMFYSDMNMLMAAEPRTCLKCEKQPRAVVFLPCEHAVCCTPCAHLLLGSAAGSCPICRTPIASLEVPQGPILRTCTWQGKGTPPARHVKLEAIKEAKSKDTTEVDAWTCRFPSHGKAAAGRHDVFLSYRWNQNHEKSTSDATGAVPSLHEALEAKGVKTFWDVNCLGPGEPLVAGFTVALAGSTLAVLVMTQFSLDRVRSSAALEKDNVLLEWELALSRAKSGTGLVVVVFVGQTKWDAAEALTYPNLPHKASGLNIRRTVSDIFGQSYLKLIPSSSSGVITPSDVVEVVSKVQSMLQMANEIKTNTKVFEKLIRDEAEAVRKREKAEWDRIEPIVSAKDVVGTGGFSIVYGGKWDGADVAIKCPVSGKGDAAKMFANEALLLNGLSHPNVMRCLAFVKDPGGACYLVLPLASQGSLARPKPEAKALLSIGKTRLKVLLMIAEGIAYLHEQRVWHRDLKPENIMLALEPGSSNLRPLVSDFGSSKGDVKETVVNATEVGTRGFMAPEVANGAAFSNRSDVYSFGMLLLTFATGQPAFRTVGVKLAASTISLSKDAATLPAAKLALEGIEWPCAECFAGLMRLGAHLTQTDRRDRPPMSEAVIALGDLLTDDGGESEFYSRPDRVTSVGRPLPCALCEERPRDAVFLPCKHSLGCGACAAEHVSTPGAKCPVHGCNATIAGVEPAKAPVMRAFQG